MTRTLKEAAAYVEDYLRFCDDPTSMEDDHYNKELASAEALAADPSFPVLERLQNVRDARLKRAEGGTDYEAGFVANAKTYAEKNNLTAADFKALGVKPAVIKAAGLTGSSAPGKRARRVSVDEVAEVARSMESFTVAQLAEAASTTVATASKAVKAMGAKSTGTDPKHTGRGKAPTLYRAG